ALWALAAANRFRMSGWGCPTNNATRRRNHASFFSVRGALSKTPPPGPLPEAERGRRPVWLPLSAPGRGPGGGVFDRANHGCFTRFFWAAFTASSSFHHLVTSVFLSSAS